MVGFLIAKCEACDALVLDETDGSDPKSVGCPGCGAKLPHVSEPGTRVDGKIWREGMSKTQGRLASVRVAFRQQHSRGGAPARHERVIDHRANRY